MKILPGKPDIVLPKHKIAVFIDGDFWHGGQWFRRKLNALEDQFSKTSTKDYWLAKIRRTMHRDTVNTKKLLDEGWTTIRFWASNIRKDLEGCIAVIAEVIVIMEWVTQALIM